MVSGGSLRNYRIYATNGHNGGMRIQAMSLMMFSSPANHILKKAGPFR